MKKGSCIWCTPQGICGWYIYVLGQQVLCYAAGCKEYEPPITAETYKELRQ